MWPKQTEVVPCFFFHRHTHTGETYVSQLPETKDAGLVQSRADGELCKKRTLLNYDERNTHSVQAKRTCYPPLLSYFIQFIDTPIRMIDSCIIIAAYLNRCLYIFINSLRDYEFGNDFGVLPKMATPEAMKCGRMKKKMKERTSVPWTQTHCDNLVTITNILAIVSNYAVVISV